MKPTFCKLQSNDIFLDIENIYYFFMPLIKKLKKSLGDAAPFCKYQYKLFDTCLPF